MPPLTQTLGPWVERSDASPRARSARSTSCSRALEAALPAAHAFVQHFSPTMLNALPFYWAGYRLERPVHLPARGLALRGGALGRACAATSGARSARRAGAWRSARTSGSTASTPIWAKTFARQGLPAPVSLAELERLDAACAARGARAMLFAWDEAGRVHAVSYVVWDAHAAFYLIGGGDPELRTSGASSLLMWESIMRAREITDVFDFEGSMLRPVERFFRAFGGRQTPYLRVSRGVARARARRAGAAGGACCGSTPPRLTLRPPASRAWRADRAAGGPSGSRSYFSGLRSTSAAARSYSPIVPMSNQSALLWKAATRSPASSSRSTRSGNWHCPSGRKRARARHRRRRPC